MLVHRDGAGTDDEVVDTELDPLRAELLVEFASQCDERIHPGAHGDLVVGDGRLGFNQALSDHFAHGIERDIPGFERSARCRERRWHRRGGLLLGL